MKTLFLFGAPALSLAVAACGEPATAPEAATTPMTNATAETEVRSHAATGEITEISDRSVTISHGPVETIGWPAMTMAFAAGSPEMVEGLNVGDPVAFEFRKSGDGYALTSIGKAE